MAIKETPINIKQYYKLMKDRTSKLLEETIAKADNIEKDLCSKHKELNNNIDKYLTHFDVDLKKYKEFVDNCYDSGTLLRVAKGLFLNRHNNYELVADLYDLYSYSRSQKELYDLKKEIRKYDTLLDLTISEYTSILRTYYTEVHKQLIVNGFGYAFGEGIGWICINRCLIKKVKPVLDYAATKKREQELIAQGKRIYNKEEAAWCLRNGIEYIAEDKRVYRKDEYCYEIPLIHSKCKNGTNLKLEISDYRHTSVRGKTNEDLIQECKGDLNKICDLQIDLKTKLTLCDKADKMLYTKFIRNEDQTSITFTKVNSKNRQ